MLKLHKFHGMEGHITVVMGKPGRKWIHYVEVGYPIRVRKVKVSEAKFFRELNQTTKGSREQWKISSSCSPSVAHQLGCHLGYPH
jgi:hypothetical protein